jgi:hypothetical protein
MKRLSLVVFAFALPVLAAGCASTAGTSSPSASPVLIGPNTDAPRIGNSDAAGVGSVPGYHSVTPEAVVVTPAPAVVTPAPVIVVPEKK